MGKIIAVLPVNFLHYIVGTVVVRQVDKPIGHRVVASWTDEKYGHVLRAAFLFDSLRKEALNDVLPISRLM